jgi:hypothetical protein
MSKFRWRKPATIASAVLLTAALGGVAATNHDVLEALGLAQEPGAGLPMQPRERAEMLAGEDPAEAGEEAFEARTISEQFAQARYAPGIVSPGAYSAAYSQLGSLAATKGSWREVTKLRYDADDPRYRDYASNSSGGAGDVTGRVTGLAADNGGFVYAAGADGGVWRSSTGGGNWTPIADQLPSLSSGDLVLATDGSLWYATGEANTGGTSYVGAGVYRLGSPRTGQFTSTDRVGGTELESTVINKVRFFGGKVWAATNRGLFSHPMSSSSGAWHLEFTPNPSYLPGGANAGTANAAYKNIVNDVAVDPRNAKHVVVASAWRSGDTYNGFYETADYTAGGWQKVNPTGAMPADDIGYVTFAFSADGGKLYAINQSPKLLNKPAGNVNSYLDGIYVSNTGSPAGPWNKIADSSKLGNSGSALKQTVIGKGYGPGIQAWYNQFLTVDPANPNHIWAGLEEVYESTDGGANWKTIGPYWNFYFPCWNISDSKNTCPDSTHPDQHSVAVGNGFVYVGNDGGIYRRPINGQTNRDGHATDWKSLNDGSMDALQYYSVALGKDPAKAGTVVSGGLQDNGASILRAGDTVMGSHFGGDGGDAQADPANGCRQVQEYTNLAMRVTENCNANTGPGTLETSTSRDIRPYTNAPGDEPARFIAPFAPDDHDANVWVAGGQHVWVNTKGYSIQNGKGWTNVFDLGAGHTATSVAVSGGTAYVGWCGPCNNAGFARGVAVGKVNDPASWHQLTLPGDFQNRFVQGVGVDPTDSGATWKDVSTNLPDVPASSIKELSNGGLVLATDLATFYRAPGATDWQRLGTGLPLTVGMDAEYNAVDNSVYVATHGRGIWAFDLAQL